MEDTQDWGGEADEDEECEDLDEDEEEDGGDDSQESDTTSSSAAGDTSPKSKGSRASSPASEGGGSGLWGNDAGDASDASDHSCAASSDPKHDRIQQLTRMLGAMRKEQTAKTFVSIISEFTFCFDSGPCSIASKLKQLRTKVFGTHQFFFHS